VSTDYKATLASVDFKTKVCCRSLFFNAIHALFLFYFIS
jgi:hypothetical protein